MQLPGREQQPELKSPLNYLLRDLWLFSHFVPYPHLWNWEDNSNSLTKVMSYLRK